MRTTRIYFCLFLGSLVTGLILVVPSFGIFQWFSMVPTIFCILKITAQSKDTKKIKLKKLYKYGFFSFFIYYLVTFHFFYYMYPMEFVDGMTPSVALVLVVVANVGLSVLQAFFGGFLFVVYGFFAKGSIAARVPLIRPAVLAALWAVYEWTQTLGWFGVPWSRLALGQTNNILWLQSASLFGSYFITFLIVVFNGYIACAVLSPDKRRTASIVALVIMLSNTIAGAVLLNMGKNDGEMVKVAAVQGNISSAEKWSANSTKKTLENYEKYTRAAAESDAKIIVWPESAIPYTINPNHIYAVEISKIAVETGTTILVGTLTASDSDDFNSIMYFNPDGTISETIYNKRRLVPFGEFVPMEELINFLFPPLANLVLSGSYVTPGIDSAVAELDSGIYGSLICFDSIYEDLALQSVRDGAEILCVSTNDSWFADSYALYMHNSQSQLRAVETGRYVVRAANTGVSSVITNKGKIISILDPNEEGVLVEEVKLISSKTLYTHIGNLLIYLFITAISTVFLFEIIFALRKRIALKNKTEEK